jgi:hypothetical protein
MNLQDTLNARKAQYGDFTDHARVAQAIKKAMKDSPNWERLPDFAKEALEMTAHKYGRMLCGNWQYTDNLIDILGYNRLCLDRVESMINEKSK